MQSLAFKSARGDWGGVPGGPTSIEWITGAAGATVDASLASAWQSQAAVYVLRQTDGHLLQLSFDSMANESWTDLSISSPSETPVFLANPPLVASFVPGSAIGTGYMVIASVTNYLSLPDTSEVTLCVLAHVGDPCTWVHASGAAGRPGALAIGTSCGTETFDLYAAFSDSGQLGRFRWTDSSATGAWDGAFTPSIPNIEVDGNGLQAWSVGTTCLAAVGGTDITMATDTLLLLSLPLGGPDQWTDLIVSSRPRSRAPQTITSEIGNIAQGAPGANVLWVIEEHNTAPFGTPLWRCDLTLGTPPTCAWTPLGSPADGRVGFTLTGTADTVYTTGHNGGIAVYVWGNDGAEWQNHLTLRAPTVVLGGPSVAELVSAERQGTGTVVIVGALNEQGAALGGATPFSWVSNDDGSTFQPVPYPALVVERPALFPLGLGDGDANVVFDAAGTAYATVVADAVVSPLGLFPGSAQIASMTNASSASPTWGPVSVIRSTVVPATSTTVEQFFMDDRPWLAASPTDPNVLYMTFASHNAVTGDFEGRFAYCAGHGDCALPGASWCPGDGAESNAYVLPSPCTSATFGGRDVGCWVDVDPRGDIWIAVQSDPDCRSQPFTESLSDSIGFHRMTPLPTRHPRRLFTCPTPAQFHGRFGPARACLYFVRDVDPSLCLDGDPSPCYLRHWASQISVAHDRPGVVGVGVEAYRDIVTGGPCRSVASGNPSIACRADQMFAYFDETAGQWCGETCTGTHAIDQNSMVVVNQDPGGALFLPQQDHIVPAIVSLDYLHFGMSWVDFRTPSGAPNATALAIASAMIDGSPLGTTHIFEQYPWPDSAGVFNTSNLVSYGDFNQPTAARGHTHFVNTTTPFSTGASVPLTRLMSPFTAQP